VAVDSSTFDVPSFNLDTEAVPLKREFLGIVVADEPQVKQWPDGKISKKWHLAVRPVDYLIGGATGAWHMYAPVTNTENSVMMGVLNSFRDVLGEQLKQQFGRTPDIMKGELVGVVAHFERKDLVFERKGREPFTFEGVLYVVAPATYEEEQRARDLPEYTPPATSDNTAVDVQPAQSGPAPTQTLSPEQADKLTALYDGRSDIEAAKEAAAKPDEYGDVRQLVVSTQGIKQLVDSGLMVRTPEGKYERAEA
jgi:hypothetical protein